MLLLDAAFRFSGITILLLVAVIALRDARHLLQGRLAAAMCICLSGMLLNTMPDWYEAPFSVVAIAWIIHIPNIVLLWLFALSLFQDDFEMRRLHWAAMAAQSQHYRCWQQGLDTSQTRQPAWRPYLPGKAASKPGKTGRHTSPRHDEKCLQNPHHAVNSPLRHWPQPNWYSQTPLPDADIRQRCFIPRTDTIRCRRPWKQKKRSSAYGMSQIPYH